MVCTCFFTMRVRGTESNVDEFFRSLRGQEEYDGQRCKYISHGLLLDTRYESGDKYVYDSSGYCYDSIRYLLANETGFNNLCNLSKRFELEIEMYSSNDDVGFQEHYVISHGEVIVEDHIDAILRGLTELDDTFWNNKAVKDAGITKENYREFAQYNFYINVGGYDWDCKYVK